MAPAIARRNAGRTVGDPGSIITRAGVEGLATAASWRDPAGRAVARRRACAAMALPTPARVACVDGGDLPGRAAAGHFAVASPRSVRPPRTHRGLAGIRILRRPPASDHPVARS